jgi:cell division protease FtsH
VLASIIFVNYFSHKLINKSVTKISYTEFLEKVKKNEVKKVMLDINAPTIVFEDIKENLYKTDNPREEGFKAYLLKEGVEVSENSKSYVADLVFMLIRFAIFYGIIFYFMKASVDKIGASSKVEEPSSSVPDIKFDDIGGYREVKEDMKFLISFLKDPKQYKEMGAKLPKGVIFYGPPGNGKTLLVKAMAGEANVPVFTVSGSDFVEMYVGVGAKRVRTLFANARKNAPCIIFIDEIDAVGGSRGSFSAHSENIQTINALLSELDGFNGAEGVLVIGATNRIEDLDEALIRPGRFDKHIGIGMPEFEDRKAILEIYMKDKNFEEGVTSNDLAKMTIGFSGSGLFSFINESAIIAVNKKHDVIHKNDIDDAYYKILMAGSKKRSKDRKKEEIELIAWHEAGHALAAKLYTKREVPKISIVPSSSGAGGVTFVLPDKMGLHTKDDLINDIRIAYGGRVAEYVLTKDANKVTTGASNDIKEATKTVKDMISIYGMSSEYGMLNLQVLSNSYEDLIIKEVKNFSNLTYTEVLESLSKHEELLREIAGTLIEKETIEEDELDKIIEDYFRSGDNCA